MTSTKLHAPLCTWHTLRRPACVRGKCHYFIHSSALMPCCPTTTFYFYSTSNLRCTMQNFLLNTTSMACARHGTLCACVRTYVPIHFVVCPRREQNWLKCIVLYPPDGSAAAKTHEHAVTVSFARCLHGSARAASVSRSKNRLHSEMDYERRGEARTSTSK